MRYKLLGRSGLRVSELCLGTMTFGDAWGWGAGQQVCREMFDFFLEAGGNFIDTSTNYTDGQSEEILGDLIADRRESLVLATKYSLTSTGSLDPNSGGNSRKNMMGTVERSLKRLKTEYIDLLYLHMWDYLTPVEEVMRGLDDLIRSGKVQYIGISDSPSWIVAQANTLAELRGWSRLVALQVPYSLLDRAVERSMLPMAEHWGMAVTPWGILEGGILSGKYLAELKEPARHDPENIKQLPEKNHKIVAELQRISEELGRPMSQVAINWVRANRVQPVIPLIGARSLEQLSDNLGALEWILSEEHQAALDLVSQIDLGFPQTLIRESPYLFGKTYALIDQHR
jgi:aryl-alcohol dehydrogenase-like predicted oxidoreductase